MNKRLLIGALVTALIMGCSGQMAFGMSSNMDNAGRSVNSGHDHHSMKHGSHEGMHHGHQHGHGQSKEKLSWDGMAQHMISMMKTIADMSQALTDTMAREMSDEKIGKIGEVMDAISTQMTMMTDMMNNREATEAEMHSLHMNISRTEEMLKQIK